MRVLAAIRDEAASKNKTKMGRIMCLRRRTSGAKGCYLRQMPGTSIHVRGGSAEQRLQRGWRMGLTGQERKGVRCSTRTTPARRLISICKCENINVEYRIVRLFVRAVSGFRVKDERCAIRIAEKGIAMPLGAATSSLQSGAFWVDPPEADSAEFPRC